MNSVCVYHSDLGACFRPRHSVWRAIPCHTLEQPKRCDAKFRRSGHSLVTLNRQIRGAVGAVVRLGFLQSRLRSVMCTLATP